MASSALCCPVRQVLVHVYPGPSKAWSEPRVTVHIGRRGRLDQKPRLMPLRTALSVARKLQAAGVGTGSRCCEAAMPLLVGALWGPCFLDSWLWPLGRQTWRRWRGGRETGSAWAVDAPLGRWAVALPAFPMASPLSIGIEIQPAGVDRRWVRLWILDRSGSPSARCRLVVRSAALQRARELQVATGARAAWWV